jgi:hypothetical protein
MRMVWRHAEQHKLACLRRLNAADDCCLERIAIGDQLIRWREQHQRIRIKPDRHQRGDAGGGCRVPHLSLKHDGPGLNPDLIELIGDWNSVFDVPMYGIVLGMPRATKAKASYPAPPHRMNGNTTA